ncbi:uncharacterized protein BKA78DRAFT_292215 [Phyllosticta capitalensis]|uniref:uncharacterized protein n=1 Tax=Phyllosticta capitalensis TaxID=121624 RepID=UPI00312DC1CA
MARFPASRQQRGSPRSSNSGENTDNTLVACTRQQSCRTDDLELGSSSDSARSSPPPYASVDALKRRSHGDLGNAGQTSQGRTRGGGRGEDLRIPELALTPPGTSESLPLTPPSISSSSSPERQQQQQEDPPSLSRALAPIRLHSSTTSSRHRAVSAEELYSIPRLPPPAPNPTALSIPDTIRLFTTCVGIVWCIAVPILWTTLGKTYAATHKYKTNALFRGQLAAACGLAALGGVLIEITLSIVVAKRRIRRIRAVASLRRSTRGWCAERGVDHAEVMAGLTSYETGDRVWFRAALMAVICVVVVLMVLVGFVLH